MSIADLNKIAKVKAQYFDFENNSKVFKIDGSLSGGGIIIQNTWVVVPAAFPMELVMINSKILKINALV